MNAHGRLVIASLFALTALDGAANPGVRAACTATTKNTRLCLEASLQYRCFNYGNFSLRVPAPVKRCNEAVTAMLDILDLVQVPVAATEKNPDDPIEKSGLMLKQVLFANNLRDTFRRPEIAGYFQAALLALQDSVRFGRANNLWDTVYTHSRFNRNLALRIIGIAAQDVSFGIWHLRYLDGLFEREKLPKDSSERMNLRAVGEFTVLFQENLENNVSFSPYPVIANGLEKSLHPYLHHFYLPAYLASELSRTGKTKEQAFFAAFLLNTGYEFVKLDSKTGEPRWPFHDPKKFDPKTYELQARKIYTGYVGALWGIGLESHAQSYEVFARELAADPYGSMQKHFKTVF